MTDAVPSINVIDSPTAESDPKSASTVKSPIANIHDETKLSWPQSRNGRPTSSGKPASTLSKALLTGQSNALGQDKQSAQAGTSAAIDPLSQHIMKRTQTNGATSQWLQPASDGGPVKSIPSRDSTSEARQRAEALPPESLIGSSSNKKNRVSFLSRFIGSNKKKGSIESYNDAESEIGDGPRAEGMDAQVFSQPVENLGFVPKHAQPPGYIKVRSKFKKEKEFNHVFLAQELRRSKVQETDGQQPPKSPSISGPPGTSRTHNDPIWALEFSKDGKYLAAAGLEKIVRVWAVISTPEDRRAHEKTEEAANGANEAQVVHLNAPVFQKQAVREYQGHTSTVLDLSWSKNNFLLSSSMDKTVRLWHVSRAECLCTFKHTDFVPSIQFHPRDDRFFLAGSLDSKLRLWSIPDKSVAFWTQVPDMITAVSFTPDGKTAIAGTLGGLCMFYETEGLKYQTQLHVKSSHGKNAKGSKVTGIQSTFIPPHANTGDIKLLISSNDSRIRLYNYRDKSLELKFKGHENDYSQIRASFSDDARHIICGSEDKRAYIWSSAPAEGDKTQQAVELFDAHTSITTSAILAPAKTRQLLSNSEDPVYDICNPPPVTLVSRAESVASSRAPTESGSAQATPQATPQNSAFQRPEASPAYVARSAHPGGNIVVTADFSGCIKVFRQDCAHTKRRNDSWETASLRNKLVTRTNSIRTGRSRRDSNSTQAPSERILSWRQGIHSTSSIDGTRKGSATTNRSISPRKSLSQISMVSSARNGRLSSTTPDMQAQIGPVVPPDIPSIDTSSPADSARASQSGPSSPAKAKRNTTTIPASFPASNPASQPYSSTDPSPGQSATDSPAAIAPPKPPSPTTKEKEKDDNPLWVSAGQSWAFWNFKSWNPVAQKASSQATKAPQSNGLLAPRPPMETRGSFVSQLSDELSLDTGGDDYSRRPSAIESEGPSRKGSSTG